MVAFAEEWLRVSALPGGLAFPSTCVSTCLVSVWPAGCYLNRCLPSPLTCFSAECLSVDGSRVIPPYTLMDADFPLVALSLSSHPPYSTCHLHTASLIISSAATLVQQV